MGNCLKDGNGTSLQLNEGAFQKAKFIGFSH